MIELRPYANLGKAEHGWLSARFHFSFAGYRDPRRMGWGNLLVWNNDRIKAGTGFDPHGHRDMEIVTYVLKGAITHQDNQGNHGRTEAGQIQVMSAGDGIVHAEYNRETEETELFQIWVLPDKVGRKPRWETVEFPREGREGKLTPLASGRGEAGAIPLYADAALYAATLKKGASIEHDFGGRHAYLVAPTGGLTVSGASGTVTSGPRDGVAIAGEGKVSLTATADSEIVLVDGR